MESHLGEELYLYCQDRHRRPLGRRRFHLLPAQPLPPEWSF